MGDESSPIAIVLSPTALTTTSSPSAALPPRTYTPRSMLHRGRLESGRPARRSVPAQLPQPGLTKAEGMTDLMAEDLTNELGNLLPEPHTCRIGIRTARSDRAGCRESVHPAWYAGHRGTDPTAPRPGASRWAAGRTP